MRRLIDAELAEDLLDVGAAHEAIAIEDGDGVAIGEDAEVGIGDPGLQLAQLRLAVLEDARDPSR